MPRMILSPGNTIKVAVQHSMDQQFHCRMTIINLTSVRAWLFKVNMAKDKCLQKIFPVISYTGVYVTGEN